MRVCVCLGSLRVHVHECVNLKVFPSVYKSFYILHLFLCVCVHVHVCVCVRVCVCVCVCWPVELRGLNPLPSD